MIDYCSVNGCRIIDEKQMFFKYWCFWALVSAPDVLGRLGLIKLLSGQFIGEPCKSGSLAFSSTLSQNLRRRGGM